jgi:SAM-dependent methyltransferase
LRLRSIASRPDPFIRPTLHDLAYTRWVANAPPSVRILNIGSGEAKPIAKPNVVNMDITEAPHVHVIGDGHALPFATAAFDGVLCRAVLEHVREPQQVVGEIRRVLRPGGFVLASAPFAFPYHGHPDDYQRFTASGLRQLFREFDEIECQMSQLPTATMITMTAAYAGTFSDTLLISRGLQWVVGWMLWPSKFLDHYLKRKVNARLLASYYFLGAKPNGSAA